MKNQPGKVYFALAILGIVITAFIAKIELFSAWFLGPLLLLQFIIIWVIAANRTLHSPRSLQTFRWQFVSVTCVLITIFSVIMYYHGPRVVTEADGPATVRYICVYGEWDPTTNYNQPLCVLKFMPVAASNVPLLINRNLANTNYPVVITWVLMETVVIASWGIAALVSKRLQVTEVR